jgi:hypothetical protein
MVRRMDGGEEDGGIRRGEGVYNGTEWRVHRLDIPCCIHRTYLGADGLV